MQMSLCPCIVSELGTAVIKKLPKKKKRERERNLARPAFECLSVSCGGKSQQCTATGAGALGAADLGVP